MDDVEPADGTQVNGSSVLPTNASAITPTPTSSVIDSANLSKDQSAELKTTQHSQHPAPKITVLPETQKTSSQVKVQEIRRTIGTLKFVRTADGKGYMRRQTDNLLQKAKATAAGKSVLRSKNIKKNSTAYLH